MNIEKKISLLSKLKSYLLSDNSALNKVINEANEKNAWFTIENIKYAIRAICNNFLEVNILEKVCYKYKIPSQIPNPKTVGIVMAGNIPLVGFHDFLMVMLSGHNMKIKLSDKDSVLFNHLIEKLTEWENSVSKIVECVERLNKCDAYIATGSTTTGKYFQYYFGKYPSIIRQSRVSVAVLDGNETNDELKNLARDVFMYFGLGCRNVRKLFVPQNYDFANLLDVFRRYDDLCHHHKYKSNYDYRLAIQLINNKKYFSTEAIILTEEKDFFAPISQLYFEYYDDKTELLKTLKQLNFLQCIVGKGFAGFGSSQTPCIFDFADGVDTMEFLQKLR